MKTQIRRQYFTLLQGLCIIAIFFSVPVMGLFRTQLELWTIIADAVFWIILLLALREYSMNYSFNQPPFLALICLKTVDSIFNLLIRYREIEAGADPLDDISLMILSLFIISYCTLAIITGSKLSRQKQSKALRITGISFLISNVILTICFLMSFVYLLFNHSDMWTWTWLNNHNEIAWFISVLGLVTKWYLLITIINALEEGRLLYNQSLSLFQSQE